MTGESGESGEPGDRRSGGRPRLFPDGMDQIQLYCGEQPLQADLRRCGDLGWETIEFDTSTWSEAARMHDDLAHRLGFPAWYGRNLDALADLAFEVAAGRLGFSPSAPGGVLLFRHVDAFAGSSEGSARAVLEIFVTASHRALQHGWALAILVQSDDPDFRVDPLAATVVGWNRAERSRPDRHRLDDTA